MDKQELKINYDGSGVKILYGFGVFFFIAGVIALLVAVIGWFSHLGNSGSSYSADEATALVGASLAGTFFPIGIALLFAGAVCIGLSSIVKTALYQRTVLESQYEFLDIKNFGVDAINTTSVTVEITEGWAESATAQEKYKAEKLIPNMRPNQVITYVYSKNKMEIWSKSFWEEESNNPDYKLIYKN
jgi:hypothetical protein